MFIGHFCTFLATLIFIFNGTIEDNFTNSLILNANFAFAFCSFKLLLSNFIPPMRVLFTNEAKNKVSQLESNKKDDSEEACLLDENEGYQKYMST